MGIEFSNLALIFPKTNEFTPHSTITEVSTEGSGQDNHKHILRVLPHTHTALCPAE